MKNDTSSPHYENPQLELGVFFLLAQNKQWGV